MGVFRTSNGRRVFHCHVVSADECPVKIRTLSDAETEDLSERVRTEFPGTDEVRPATFEYNCYGFALAMRHGFFLSAQAFFTDDFDRVPLDEPRVGDVAVYYNPRRYVEMHVAVVKEVTGNQITLLQSKWGRAPEVRHGPTNVPKDYGTIGMLLRRV